MLLTKKDINRFIKKILIESKESFNHPNDEIVDEFLTWYWHTRTKKRLVWKGKWKKSAGPDFVKIKHAYKLIETPANTPDYYKDSFNELSEKKQKRFLIVFKALKNVFLSKYYNVKIPKSHKEKFAKYIKELLSHTSPKVQIAKINKFFPQTDVDLKEFKLAIDQKEGITREYLDRLLKWAWYLEKDNYLKTEVILTKSNIKYLTIPVDKGDAIEIIAIDINDHKGQINEIIRQITTKSNMSLPSGSISLLINKKGSVNQIKIENNPYVNVDIENNMQLEAILKIQKSMEGFISKKLQNVFEYEEYPYELINDEQKRSLVAKALNNMLMEDFKDSFKKTIVKELERNKEKGTGRGGTIDGKNVIKWLTDYYASRPPDGHRLGTALDVSSKNPTTREQSADIMKLVRDFAFNTGWVTTRVVLDEANNSEHMHGKYSQEPSGFLNHYHMEITSITDLGELHLISEKFKNFVSKDFEEELGDSENKEIIKELLRFTKNKEIIKEAIKIIQENTGPNIDVVAMSDQEKKERQEKIKKSVIGKMSQKDKEAAVKELKLKSVEEFENIMIPKKEKQFLKYEDTLKRNGGPVHMQNKHIPELTDDIAKPYLVKALILLAILAAERNLEIKINDVTRTPASQAEVMIKQNLSKEFKDQKNKGIRHLMLTYGTERPFYILGAWLLGNNVNTKDEKSVEKNMVDVIQFLDEYYDLPVEKIYEKKPKYLNRIKKYPGVVRYLSQKKSKK